MAKPDNQTGGQKGPLQRRLASVLALAHNRVQLFAVELEAEKLRWVETLLKLALATAVGMIGLMMAAAALVLFVWEKARYAGLLVVTGVFLGVAAFLFWRLRDELRREPLPFEKTTAEFKKDRECFTGKD